MSSRNDLRPHFLLALIMATASAYGGQAPAPASTDAAPKWGMVIHTGAGNFTLENLGTYASNASCAISATGTGEYFIRFTVGKDICARVEYRGVPAQTAAEEVIQGVLKPAGGEGGVVGLDRHGALVMSFNTTGMGRGYVGEDGKPSILFTADK